MIAVTIDPDLPNELRSVVTSYDAIADAALKSSGAAKKWRNIFPPGWPTEIHYEFLSRPERAVGVELHCGGKHAGPVALALSAEVPRLRAAMPGLHWDSQFRPGRGRLAVVYPDGTDPRLVAYAMAHLLRLTMAVVAAELGKSRP